MRRQFLLRLLASAATLALVVAGPVGADDADPIAAKNADRKIFHDRPIAVGLADTYRLNDQLGRHARISKRHLHRAGRAATFAAHVVWPDLAATTLVSIQ
mgnify:CR=1 FL=1